MTADWTDGYITVGDSHFHYTRTGHGDKPPLLLLHGLSDNGLCWLPVAQAVEAEFDVIMPDARGHGLSPRLQPDEPLDHGSDAAGLIEALGLRRPVVCGHSMGGLTATQLGARYPHLVSGLILEDPAWIDRRRDDLLTHDNPFFTWLQEVHAISLEDVIALGKAMNPTWSDVEFPAWAESKRQLDPELFYARDVRVPWRDCLSMLKVPTLLVTADVARNAVVTPAIAQEAVSRSPFVQAVHIPGAGHNIRRENFAGFMDAVHAFLSQFKP